MTYRPDLSGCWAKLARAKEHREALEAATERALGEEGNRVILSCEYDPERGNHAFRVSTMPDALIMRWGLILGEVMHNFRGALDHLVWQLTVFGNDGREPARRNGIQFPIRKDPPDPEPAPEDFEKGGALRKLVPRHRAIIEGHQPYNGWHGEWIHPFLQLQDISNQDKHRALGPLYCANANIDIYNGIFEPWGATIHDATFAKIGSRVERGAVLARATLVPPGVQCKVDVAGEAVPFVRLPDTEGYGVTLIPTLDEIGTYVARVLSDFEPLL